MVMDTTEIMKHKTAYLTTSEIQKMLNYCFKKERVRDYMLILILSRTGRRITEIVGKKPYTLYVGLRPCDIHPGGLIEFDILKKNPVMSKNKNGQPRSEERVKKDRLTKKPKRQLFPIDDTTINILQQYINNNNIQTHQRVFPITRQRADVITKDISKACKISRPGMKIHAHNFRHSFAINLLKDNPDDASILIQVQELLDHSNLNITKTYLQFTPEDKRRKLNKLFKRK